MSYSTAQLNAFRDIYNYFYGYALSQGADPSTALEFAHMGMGVAATEGINAPNWRKPLWGWSGDQETSIGPFQLHQGGLADLLGGDTSPLNQLRVAAQVMWNGNSPFYNTRDWFGVGDYIGQHGFIGNNSYAGQTAVERLGASIDQKYGISSGAAPGALPGTTPGTSSDTTAPATGGSASDTSGLGSIAPQGTGAGALFGIGTPGGTGSAFANFPSSLAKIKGMQPIGQATKLPIFAGGGGLGTSAEGERVYISDISYAGKLGLEKQAEATKGAGEQIKQGSEDIATKVQQSEQHFSTTVQEQTTRAIKQSKNLGDWFSQLTAGASGLVTRIGVGAAAIVLIGLALWLAGREQLA